MTSFQVTRAHLKKACEQKNWDLLDKLLELDSSNINDHALFTDTWGEWWGLLLECVKQNEADGVRVLLSHGADKTLASWGDCIPLSPLEAAQDKPDILALLQTTPPPTYIRHSDPDWPALDVADHAVNRQGEIGRETGLIFQTEALE